MADTQRLLESRALAVVEMDSLSIIIYDIVIVFMCNSIVSDTIGVSNASSDQWRLAISVSTRKISDESTRSPTFGERSEHTSEYIGTKSVSDSDTTDNAPTLDPGCRDDNATDLFMNTPSDPMSPSKVSFAVDVINRLQPVITSVGFFANAATYVTLTFNSERLSPLILLLIKHQALIDTAVCGMGSLQFVLPTRMWFSGSRIVDFLICHCWHTQLLFWACVLVSTLNLLLIAVERYIMICKPFVYLSVKRRHFFYGFALLYFASVFGAVPYFLHTKFIDGECSIQIPHEGFWYRFNYGYSFFVMFAFYIFPTVAFAFLYGYVAYT